MHFIDSGGAHFPALGFGTFELDDAMAQARVGDALEIGYRHIDTARAYHNELGVGRALASADVPRPEIFLTTKLWFDEFTSARVGPSIRESLDRLGTDYLDLVLLHWPNADVPVLETLEALAQAREDGLVRHCGLSNFPVARLDEALSVAPIPLVTNQVEYHPFIDQQPLLDHMRAVGMPLTAYCPLAQGRVIEEPLLRRIASDNDATPTQVALAWLLAHGDVAAIPRSGSRAHLEENFAAALLALDDAALEAIGSLRARHERLIDPDFAPRWDPPTSRAA